jgi:hypothetical protein
MPRSARVWIVSVPVVVIACTAAPSQRPAVCEEGSPGCAAAERNPKPVRPGDPVPPPPDPDDDDDTTPPVIVPDAGSPADAGDAAPPPKGASCLSAANACFHVQAKCGCLEDCCSGYTCAVINTLGYDACCLVTGKECVLSKDCCGPLVCRPNDAGKSTCQP